LHDRTRQQASSKKKGDKKFASVRVHDEILCLAGVAEVEKEAFTLYPSGIEGQGKYG
jgi:hypothetical protein